MNISYLNPDQWSENPFNPIPGGVLEIQNMLIPDLINDTPLEGFYALLKKSAIK